MQLQAEPRVRRRLPCTLDTREGHRQGLVLNLSRSGLFVQTNLPPAPGTSVAIDLSGPDAKASIRLRGEVVWRRRVSSRMTGTTQSGVGLRLETSDPGYEDLLREIDPTLCEGLEGPEATASAAAPVRHFAVRVGLRGSSRSRLLQIEAADEQEATRRALGEAGEGWSLVELRERED